MPETQSRTKMSGHIDLVNGVPSTGLDWLIYMMKCKEERERKMTALYQVYQCYLVFLTVALGI